MKKRFDSFDKDGVVEDKATEKRAADLPDDQEPCEDAPEEIPYFTVRFPGESPFPAKSGEISLDSQNPGLKPDQRSAGFPHSKNPLIQRIAKIRSCVGLTIKKFRK